LEKGEEKQKARPISPEFSTLGLGGGKSQKKFTLKDRALFGGHQEKD